MAEVLYLETGSQDPHYNLAFEEFVLLNRTQGDILMLWQNANSIIIGQNQNTEAEINRTFVEQHGIQVVRRTTGGGAVYHDLGNLNYSFITDVETYDEKTRQQFAGPIVRALEGLGLSAEASGRNDILVNGCKVSGTAQRVQKGRILHHGTLLFEANMDMVSGALRVDQAKLQSKGVQSVRSRVGNIRSFLEKDMTLPEFWAYLKVALQQDGLRPDTLSEAELAQVRQLQKEKYDTWEWNFGRSLPYSYRSRKRFPGGTLEVQLELNHGRISDIRFYGDFLSRRPLTQLQEQLTGLAFERRSVSAVLGAFPLGEFFGTITKDEILEVLFEA